MSEIKNKGIPTRKTKGALGDIYVDTATNIKYKCTGAYTIGNQSEYEWKPVKPNLFVPRTAAEQPHKDIDVKPVAAPETKVDDQPEPETKVDDQPEPETKVDEEEVVVDQPETPVKEEKPADNHKRKNNGKDYGKYYRG